MNFRVRMFVKRAVIFTFLQNKMIFRLHKPFIVAKNRIVLVCRFFDAKTQIYAKKK